MASCSVKPEQVAKTPRWQVSPGQIFRRCFHQPRGSAQGRVNQCFHQSFTPIFSCKIHFPNFQPLVLDSSRSRFPKIVSLKLGFILNSICAWRLVKNWPTLQPTKVLMRKGLRNAPIRMLQKLEHRSCRSATTSPSSLNVIWLQHV